MKKLIFLLFFIMIIPNLSIAVSYNSDPKIFVEELVGDAVKILEDKSIDKKDKDNAIRKIALENVDIEGLGMYMLGNTRKTLDENTLNKYNLLFKKYFLKLMVSKLTDYSSSSFEILEAEQKSAIYTIVKSKIGAGSDKPAIKINWRIFTKNPSKPLIRDLIAEGLSMARVQREEFSSILSSNNNDINALLATFENFISN
jgi:phospholipid transport system substrate-binding protein